MVTLEFTSKVEDNVSDEEIIVKTEKFQCDICEKDFNDIKDLSTHLKTNHNENKNDQCNQCDMAFENQASLLKHVQAVHEIIQAYVCHICKSEFEVFKLLDKHLKVEHKICGKRSLFCPKGTPNQFKRSKKEIAPKLSDTMENQFDVENRNV